ncbi:FAD:protein FMN transferase [Paenibacillus marchantiophytorum]|uniref:FAD:protein FMN transferase n=1 Tax=Paenibacillus marchantiophytorum TaxID=1619310 RepID=A0ABQ1EP30_9BACL|nr:FAD:protein FMN transferase [Paenibacillus marchantiophytorum]GFZ80711.1 FAD:protein FMN transferase [Paenibacillus marchantiophytorum]
MEPITPSFHSFQFQAIESNVELLLSCEEKDYAPIKKLATDWFHQTEKRFSRILADSEISLLNTLAGENCMVSNTMLEVLFLAEMYQAVTDGNYNPLLPNETNEAFAASTAALEWEVDPSLKSIKLPIHSTIDLRGIDRSWSIKRLAEYIRRHMSLQQGLILAGGDMTVWGRNEQKLDPWIIGIQNPWQANAKLGAVAMPEGSLSTYNQFEDHHAAPSASDVVQCTVAGQDLVECQVWARLLCRLGVAEGLALMAKRTSVCEAVVVSANQELHYFGKEISLRRRWLDMQIDHFHFHDLVS